MVSSGPLQIILLLLSSIVKLSVGFEEIFPIYPHTI